MRFVGVGNLHMACSRAFSTCSQRLLASLRCSLRRPRLAARAPRPPPPLFPLRYVSTGPRSSLFVSSTLSDPDVTEMLNCVSLLLHHQMAEEQLHPPNPDIPAPAYDFSEDDSAPNPDDLPELEEISSFLSKTFKVAKWSPECHIMALVFVNRLTGYTNIRLHNSNWRPILLCSLLLAQKVPWLPCR